MFDQEIELAIEQRPAAREVAVGERRDDSEAFVRDAHRIRGPPVIDVHPGQFGQRHRPEAARCARGERYHAFELLARGIVLAGQ